MGLPLRHLGFSFAALAVAVGAIAACGGGSDDDGATGFDGVYRTESEGLIGAIAFVDNEDYMLMGPYCYTRECTELGTFSYDEKRQALTLTNVADGKSRQLPVSEIATERLDLNDKLSTLDLVERDAGLLGDSGTKLLDGGDAGQLVEGGVGLLDGGDGGRKLVKPQPRKIVESAKVGKQKATKATSKGTSSSSSSSGGSKDEDKKSDDKEDDDKKDDKPKTPTAPTATPAPTSPVTTVKADAGDASITVVIGGDPTCIQSVPTAKSTLPEILAYFLRCPNGIRGTAE